MLVIKQKMIYREDIRNNPKLLYIFGDNLERRGFGGQAKEMRGEPNSFGIATKRKAAHGSNDCYFWDTEDDAWYHVVQDFEKARETALLNGYMGFVIPSDGIGTNLARLSDTAPKLLKSILLRLDNIGNFKYDANHMMNP